VKIVYAVLPGRDIYNSSSPDHIHHFIKRYGDKWWSDDFAPLRAKVVQWFREFYEINTGGHYSKLLESVLEHGFQNPIIVTAGKPLRRPAWMLPPSYPQHYLCEANGGSRLAVAQELDIDVPCIINGNAPGEELHSLDDVMGKFTDKTYTLRLHDRQGVLSTPTNLSHLGKHSMAETQIAVRKSIKQVIKKMDDYGNNQLWGIHF